MHKRVACVRTVLGMFVEASRSLDRVGLGVFCGWHVRAAALLLGIRVPREHAIQ